MVETHYNIKNAPRIALLADFHNGNPEPIISSLRRHDINLIAIAGDMVYGRPGGDDKSPLDTQENVTALLASCASIAPTYMSLGNHEWFLRQSDIQRIKDLGVVVLDNEYVECSVGGETVSIGGLTSAHVLEYRRFLKELKAVADGELPPGESRLLSPSVTPLEARERLLSAYPKRLPSDFQKPARKAVRGAGKPSPSISWLERFTRVSGYRLLISHHPEYFDLIPTVDLLLSGHAHGGQIRLFHHGLFAPGQGILPTYTKGVYGRMVVSAGLTNTTWVPRINNPTEIVYINCG